MEFSRRKWGWYFTLLDKRHFKVKFLYFKKFNSCSMQRHFKRSEMWCFLFGYGIFCTGNRLASVYSGDYENVSIGEWHQYKALTPTLVLEIQTGECRESDIERK